MIHSPRSSPRSEYQQQENLRAQASPVLREKFPTLKSLTVDLGHFCPESTSCSSQIKYSVNVAHAKSVFRVGCHNQECVRGDFDLTEIIAAAVTAKRAQVSGETRCPGWRNRVGIDTVPCRNVLRYKLTLGY